MSEETLFERAVGLPPADRAAFLDRECPDPALRARVEALLAADAQPDSPLDRPADPTLTSPLVGEVAAERRVGGQDVTADDPGRDQQPGVVIGGKYTLVEPVGEGGMGAVWRAKQTDPVKRYVAVKLIKAGMDSRRVLARFEAERQALALMDHPSIAKVLDGGVHAGRPYFVMELVKGVPITDYCDARKLTPRERLELFVPVCQAVQHAHQKGGIHRDLKPSNVLVALYDDRPVPKVIDFGVAKAAGAALTERTIDTGFGGVVGTPQYMSPEQATFNNLDIDTRSDVYALGVLLYELLTGSPPFSKKDLEQKGLLEILRVVREEEPPRPSTKLSTADALPTLSANRGTEPKKLTGLLRNELDWVVMKALEKDRARRYETANGFAADVQRYLAGEAVLAHPPGTAYRLKKFVRRNRPQVVAAGLVLLALVAGVVGTAWQAVRADRARQAETVQREAAEENERKAVAAADGERVARLDAQEKERRAVAAAESEKAARLAEERERKYAEAIAGFVKDDFLALTSVEGQDRFGGDGKGGLSKDTTLRELLDRAAGKLRARTDLDPRTEAELCWIVGVNYRGAGAAAEAVGFLERAVQLRGGRLGRDHPDTLDAMNSLGVAYAAAGRLDKALPLLVETLALMREKLGAGHPDTLYSMNNLAAGYHATGQLDKALPLLEETLAVRREKLGAGHPDTLYSMNSLGVAYAAAGRLDKALPLLVETLALMREKLGAGHPDTLRSMGNLAAGYHATGQLDKALPLHEETLAVRREKLGAGHPDTLTSMNNLALGYRAAGQLDKALPLHEEAAAGVEKLGFRHEHAGLIVPNTIGAYEAAGQLDRADGWRRKWLAFLKADGKGNTPAYAGELAVWGMSLLNRRQWADAAPVLRECLAVREKVQPDAWTTFNTKSMLGGALLGQGKYADAGPLLVAGYEGMKAREKSIPTAGGAELRLPEALDRLVELAAATNKPDEAARWRAERAKYPPPAAPPPRPAK